MTSADQTRVALEESGQIPTQGTWTLTRYGVTLLCLDEQGREIFSMKGKGHRPIPISQRVANARLCHAAPDLLEALEHLMRYDFSSSPTAIKARLAIRKARGQ